MMHFVKLGLISGAACIALVACAASDPDSTISAGGTAGTAAGGGAGTSGGPSAPEAGSGGSSANGGSASSSGGTAGIAGGFGIGGTGGAPPDAGDVGACATSHAVAEPVPARLQLVVDTSGSMNWGPDGSEAPPAGLSKWAITKTAIENTATALPASTALGLGFYPNTDLDLPCFIEQVAVPIAPLGETGSPQRQQLSTALASVSPVGATPTHAAYRFGLGQLRASDQPGNEFLVLITDGVPTFTAECSGDGHAEVDSSPIVAEATVARNEGIRTFVIGSPGSEPARAALSRIAMAGGTAPAGCSEQGPTYCHFDMSTEPDLAAALSSALASIVDQVLSCEYPVPAPPDGQTLDQSRVNVVFTSGDGVTETVPRDPSASECNRGWQYTPDGTRVTLCTDTCERVKHAAGGKVELEFGCETKIAPVE